MLRLLQEQVAKLDGTVPGSPEADALSAARATLNNDNTAVAAAEHTVDDVAARIVSDRARIRRHSPAGQAIAATVTPRPKPPAAAARQAAVDALDADQRTQTDDQARLAAATQAQTAAAAAVTQAVRAARSTVTSTYDVAYNTRGQATAWAPADYLLGAD